MPEAEPQTTPEHPIRLRNTLTRRVEPLVPLDWRDGSVPEAERRVRMYVCGPTVYDRAHLGNARSAVVFDVLFRLLRHVYGAEHVTYVRNITDIDDKIIDRARETGRPVEEITAETTRWYHEDMDALGCLRPTHEPRATQYLPQMIAMIRALVEGGHAYEAAGHVLFSVSSYEAYGRLSGRSVEDMIAGARVEPGDYKREPMDFVLWKPSGEGMPGWDSPWGRGRPGWHIECSAMARDLLGAEFDIHGGGLDLQFPHHENEIAQSACVGDSLAKVWIHNEMLMVDGRKMSKSLGNFFTVRDLLDQGVPGEVIRLVLLGSHYGKPMDWTEKKVEEARGILRRWRRQSSRHRPPVDPAIVSALKDDLNTAGAIAHLHSIADGPEFAAARAGLEFLGVANVWSMVLSPAPLRAVAQWGDLVTVAGPADGPEAVNRLVRARLTARASRDFKRADAIRDALAAAGVLVRDTPDGAEWEKGPCFDPAKLEAIE